MRKRAKSCFVDDSRKDDSLIRKFEGVAEKADSESEEREYDSEESDEEVENEEARDEIDSDQKHFLTHMELDHIVTVLKDHLNDNDKIGGTTRAGKLPWNELKFNVDSSIDVKTVVMDILKHTRKIRNLFEMLKDFKHIYTQIIQPKKPSNTYAFFTSKHYPMIKKKHPDWLLGDVAKEVSKMYKNLSEDEKNALIAQYHEKIKVYEEEVKSLQQRAPIMEKAAKVNPTKEKNVEKPTESKSLKSNGEKSTESKPQKSKSAKSSSAKLETPFSLYYDSRKASGINRNGAKTEWHNMAIKDKVHWIKQVFGDKDIEEQNKKCFISKDEMKMMEKYDGKPESIGINVYTYYFKTRVAGNFGSLPEKSKQVALEYKQLTKSEKDDLVKNFKIAKEKYIAEYSEYIKKLPKDLAKKEIIFLNKLSQGSSKKRKSADVEVISHDDEPSQSKKAKSKPTEATKSVPVQEKEEEMSDEISEELSENEADNVEDKVESEPEPVKTPTPEPPKQKKQNKRKLPEAKEEEKETLKKPKNKKKKKEADEENDEGETSKIPKKRNTRSSPSPLPAEPAEKPPRNHKNKHDESTGKKSPKTRKNTSLTVEKPTSQPPEKPPTSIQDYFNKIVYKGPEKDREEAYKNLRPGEREEITREFNNKKNRYMEELRHYLLKLPSGNVKNYFSTIKTENKKNDSSTR